MSLSSALTSAVAFLVAPTLASAGAQQGNAPPHILLMLADDWGWANVGYHNKLSNWVQTPNIDALVAQGVELDRHYVFKYCSPSRSALQTGRNPIHVNVLNTPIMQHNPNDPLGGYQGIPLNMSTVAEKLSSAGYATHQAGKWNAGMATTRHLPVSRGYDSSLHYFDYDEHFWNNSIESCPLKGGNMPMTDWWDGAGPALGKNNSWSCSQSNQAPSCEYQDNQALGRVLQVIAAHNASQPLFLFWAPHAPHDPYEVPDAYLQKFGFINDTIAQYYSAMVNLLDDHVGAVAAALKSAGLWNNLLWIASSDNGGPVGGAYGGNNWPLRGGKASNLEGGVRVNAFATGGAIPVAKRGTKAEGLIAIEDWYTTFCGLAGVDPSDPVAAAAGLPPVDGLDVWPYLSGANDTSPRTEVILGTSLNGDIQANGQTSVQGVLRSDGYKLLIGTLSSAFWQGPSFPNSSAHPPSASLECGDPALPANALGAGNGCLFNVFDDPTEQHNIAGDHPTIVQDLRERIRHFNSTVYSPHRGNDDGLACEVALSRYGGFWGPFVGV